MIKLLLIEDSPSCGELFNQCCLFLSNIDITIVTSLQASIALLDDADIVVTDLNLPDSQPDKTIKFWGAKSIPWLIYTGFDDLELIKQAAKLGCSGVINKRLDFDVPDVAGKIIFAIEKEQSKMKLKRLRQLTDQLDVIP